MMSSSVGPSVSMPPNLRLGRWCVSSARPGRPDRAGAQFEERSSGALANHAVRPGCRRAPRPRGGRAGPRTRRRAAPGPPRTRAVLDLPPELPLAPAGVTHEDAELDEGVAERPAPEVDAAEPGLAERGSAAHPAVGSPRPRSPRPTTWSHPPARRGTAPWAPTRRRSRPRRLPRPALSVGRFTTIPTRPCRRGRRGGRRCGRSGGRPAAAWRPATGPASASRRHRQSASAAASSFASPQVGDRRRRRQHTDDACPQGQARREEAHNRVTGVGHREHRDPVAAPSTLTDRDRCGPCPVPPPAHRWCGRRAAPRPFHARPAQSVAPAPARTNSAIPMPNRARAR